MEDQEAYLHNATMEGDLEKVNTILKRKLDVNAATEDLEDTALHIAAKHEDSQILHILLMAGANPNKANIESRRPLSIAVGAGVVASAVILIGFGGRLSITDLQAADPIHHACRKLPRQCRHQMIKVLRTRFALVESRSPSMVLKKNLPGSQFIKPNGTIDLLSGVDWAIRQGNIYILNYLLDMRPELIKETGRGQRQPLHRAVETRQLELAKMLLEERAAEVDAETDRGLTPLHLAAKQGNKKMVKLLLQKNANKNAKTSSHRTPAHLALHNGHASVADMLKSEGMGQDAEHDGSYSRISNEDDDNDTISQDERNASHDGVLQGINPPDQGKKSQETFRKLLSISEGPAAYKASSSSSEKDKRIGIAILDSGIDMKLKALGKDPKLTIKDQQNFATKIKDKMNVVNDTSGHGTQVAGLILKFVPHPRLYIAKVCDGEDLLGTRSKQSIDSDYQVTAKPKAIEKAILWAIDKKVQVINMSLGFNYDPLWGNHEQDEEMKGVKNALEEAKNRNILVFAAMNNLGNHEDARWPVREKDLAIGIHGSRPEGVEACSYAGMPVKGNPNLMMRGEWIETQLSKDRTEFAAGSSYATAIAASMAALILQFARRRKVENRNGLTKLHVMIRVLEEVSREARNGFRWIHPYLLWRDLGENAEKQNEAAIEHASNVIREILKTV